MDNAKVQEAGLNLLGTLALNHDHGVATVVSVVTLARGEAAGGAGPCRRAVELMSRTGPWYKGSRGEKHALTVYFRRSRPSKLRIVSMQLHDCVLPVSDKF